MKYLNLTGLARVWEYIRTYIDNALEGIPVATTEADGLMSSEDKSKLDGMDSSELDDVVEFHGLEETGSDEEIDTSIIKQEVTSNAGAIFYSTSLKTFLALCSDGNIYNAWTKTDYFSASTAYGTATSNGVTPVTGKLYVHTEGDAVYRWSGSALVKVGSSLALGETSTTAFAGNRGVALEKWKSTGMTSEGTYIKVVNGLVTYIVDTAVSPCIINYVQHSNVTNSTSGIKKLTVDKGAVSSVSDATITDIASIRGTVVTAPTNIPAVYTGITYYGNMIVESKTKVASAYNASSYYIGGTNYLGFLATASDSAGYYNDNYWIPTLKEGDILITRLGVAWIVIKALSGTTPVQVAKLGASS